MAIGSYLLIPGSPMLFTFVIIAGERAQRERLRDLAVFERLDGNPGKTSPGLAVKKVKLIYLSLALLVFASSKTPLVP